MFTNDITDACCDRCGMLYSADSKHIIITTVNGKSYDLCPECQEKLEKFMKMEEEKND